MANGQFTIKTATVRNGGFSYRTYRLTGWLNGQRIRKQFKDRAEADGEKIRLEVQAANSGEITARNTRLTPAQLTEAEAAFARLGEKSLAAAVEWYLTTYRPPVTAMPFATAETAFLLGRKSHVRSITLRDYTNTLRDFREVVGAVDVHAVNTAHVLGFLNGRGVGRKRWNNLRGDLHAFFKWCAATPRQWATENPVAAVPKYRIARGVPAIETAKRIRGLFEFLETYTGDYGKPQRPGFLVPYFALATFAGMRPSVAEGEIFKLGAIKDTSRIVDLQLNVIRVGPEIAKTNNVRKITIQPNLREWLTRYPLSKYPIVPANLKLHVTRVRERFGLKGKDDILRHTFCSMLVAKFGSLAQAALEAGNSEAIIRRHYVDTVSKAEADEFWGIVPTALAK